MAMCSRECGRVLLWLSWVTVWLITSLYVVLAVICFAKLWQAATELQYGASQLAHNKVWRAPLASLALGAALAFGYNFMCCITLIKKSVNRSGPGFGYGFMMAFSFALSMMLLLCGLILDGFRPEVKNTLEPVRDANGTLIHGAESWSQYSSEAFVGVEVFSLISFCTYLLFGFLLVILQPSISEHLGITAAAGYGLAGTSAMAEPIPTTEFKDGPAAPPDYDQYAQYEQYGSYSTVQQDGIQQYYGQGVGVYQGGADPAAAGYNTVGTGTYVAADASQMGYGAPPAYSAATGYAAVGMYNTVSEEAGQVSGLLGPGPAAPNNFHNQAI